jgi:hypothetical protein
MLPQLFLRPEENGQVVLVDALLLRICEMNSKPKIA